MLTDTNRLDAYVGALKTCVGPDSIVLDLGAGTGVFSVIACELGAQKVYALEINPLIRLVDEVAREKGYGERLEIVQKLSTQIDLDPKADILVSDIHGGFPLYETGLESIIDARERLLKEDAVIFPAEESVLFAVSQSEQIYRKHVETYLEERHGFKLPSGERLVKNRPFNARSDDEVLLSEPAQFALIDHRTNSRTSFRKELDFEINRPGIAHGLRGWFESRLPGGFSVSNAITEKNSTYSAPFFPFEHPVSVEPRDTVKATINAVYEEGNYIWSWQTKIVGAVKGLPKAEFGQSMMASMVPDTRSALRRSEFYTPGLGIEGEIDKFVLSKIDGANMSGDIADELFERFPGRFASLDKAAERVYFLVERYAEE